MVSHPASPSPFARPHAFSSAYRQVGVETGVASASAHQLVQMLFDGVQEAIVQARGAMRLGQIDAKGRAIGRAVRIVDEGLKAGLNLRAGGSLALDLDELYAYVTLRLTQANLRNDESALDECVALLQPLREAWASIAPQAQVQAHV
jgi:flagellar protein FliS